MSERLVLFGGSFDPVHRGHTAIALSVADLRGFETVTFVPAAQAPHKSGAKASAEDRLAMLRLAVAGEDRLDVCEIEVRREGPSYTIDTLESLRAQRPQAELFWIVGADMLADLPSWRRAADVLAIATILTALRAPWHEQLEGIVSRLAETLGPECAREVRQWVVPTPRVDISSTQVRQAVADGYGIDSLVGCDVADYIQRHGLYRTP